MTVFIRGSVYLTCLFCEDRDFDVIRYIPKRGKFLRCKRCGFKIKESGYFDPLPLSTPESPNEPSNFVVIKEGLADEGL